MTKRLLEYGFDVNFSNVYGWTALKLASYNNDVSMIELLLQYGADINYQGVGHNTQTPLMTSSYFGCLEATKYLLKKGADVNIKTKDNETALDLALLNKKYDVLKLFLEHYEKFNPEQQEILKKYRMKILLN
jgi:uncharacterized protein